MITLHFDHAHMAIPSEMLIEIASKFKGENYGLFVELIHTIADNAVRKIYGNIPAFPVWEYLHHKTIVIDVYVVGHEPLKLELKNNGVSERKDDYSAKMTVDEMKDLLRFFYRHNQHEQITRLIEMPSPDDNDDEPF